MRIDSRSPSSIMRLTISTAICFAAHGLLSFGVEVDEWLPVNNASAQKIGGNNTSGDCDMNTNHKDEATADIATTLYIDEQRNRVMVRIRFSFKEAGGDKTVIEADDSDEVWRPPHGRRVVEIKTEGGPVQQFHGQTHGRNNSWNPLKTGETYWEDLQFKLDTNGSDDCPHVGVKGRLGFSARVESVAN